MSLRISIDVSGSNLTQQKLDRLNHGMTHLKSAMTEIGIEAVDYYRTVGFTDRGSAWGHKWPDLSMKYKQRKEKEFPGRPILVRNGTPGMKDSFNLKAGDTQVIIGNDKSYYKYHQSPDDRSSKLPRRQMAGVNEKVKRMVQSIIESKVKEMLRDN